jgi:DNA-binding HxlR family transcriptional regulator
VEPVPNENTLREWILKPKLVIELMASKWRLMIIHALAPGTLRYGQLHRVVEKVSHKVLTQSLRSLERDGIVERRTFPVVPPRVEYSLTPLGASLLEPLGLLCHWAQEHESEIVAARVGFDQRESLWSYSIAGSD